MFPNKLIGSSTVYVNFVDTDEFGFTGI